MPTNCSVQRLGQVPYPLAWDYQNELAAEIAKGQRQDTLLLLEHPHTYTLGRGGQSENLLWPDEVLKEKGVDVLWVDRGGDITYHGPGQIVGYPILRLAPIGWDADHLPQADYVGYIRKLEDVLIATLAQFHITGQKVIGKSGVWVRPHPDDKLMKIASIGVKVDVRGVSRHGFALNIDPDMDFWQGIIPCGLRQVEMTSMAQLIPGFDHKEAVFSAVARHFGQVFGLEMLQEEVTFLKLDQQD
jgi:lipoyl(octanoyl) transferase